MAVDPSDLVDLDREWDIPNFDYTADTPSIEGTYELHPDMWVPVCECELDWRCGLHQGQYTPLELMNDEWAQREQTPEWAQ